MDPSSSCFGSSTSSYANLSGDDDTTGATTGWYHDDDVTSNSPGYYVTSYILGHESVESEDDVADDGSYYGDRDFSRSEGSAAVGALDIALGSSESSFSSVEMAGVFVLSVSAFILFGCATLAACGFLRPRWCCSPGCKGSVAAGAAVAGAAAAGAASSTRRGWSRSRPKPFKQVQHGPPSPKTEAAAEAAGDWELAAALRNSAAAARADGVDRRAYTDQQSAGGLEAGVAGAQEGKSADEVELGRAFYGTGGTGISQAGSTEGGDEGAVTGYDRSNGSAAVSDEERGGSISVVAGTAVGGDDAAMEEKGEDGIDGDAIEEEAQVGGEAEVRAVEAEEGEQENGDFCTTENEEEEKQIEPGSAVGNAVGSTDTRTPADNPEADGAVADEEGSSDPPGEHSGGENHLPTS